MTGLAMSALIICNNTIQTCFEDVERIMIVFMHVAGSKWE
jgi:hypothetical protein